MVTLAVLAWLLSQLVSSCERSLRLPLFVLLIIPRTAVVISHRVRGAASTVLALLYGWLALLNWWLVSSRIYVHTSAFQ